MLNRTHRNGFWRMSAPRTFYAGLFKLIPKKRFFYKSCFLSMASDAAIMFNLVDIARNHVYFITDYLYDYNKQSPINDFKLRGKLQDKLLVFLQNQKPLPFYCMKKEDFL